MKSKFLQIKIEHNVGKMLEKFQAQYWAETGERITKEQVVNLALPVYIGAVNKLSKEEIIKETEQIEKYPEMKEHNGK